MAVCWGIWRRSEITEIYYTQNEKQYKRILIRLIQEKDYSPDDLQEIGIFGCNYDKNNIEDWEDSCDGCEVEECVLLEHIEDKDVLEHFKTFDEDTEFPAILVFADTYFNDEKVTLISVKEAKENTKYGIRGEWN